MTTERTYTPFTKEEMVSMLPVTLCDMKHESSATERILNNRNIQRCLYQYVIRDAFSAERFLHREPVGTQEGVFIKGYVRDVWSYFDDAYRIIHDTDFEREFAALVAEHTPPTTQKTNMKAIGFPYTLETLISDAQAKFDYSNKQTLNAAYTLYERGLITYPHTNCQYLPTSMYEEAQRVIRTLYVAQPALRNQLSCRLKSAAWDDDRTAEHHGIIPTNAPAIALVGIDLSETEINLYCMIRQAFLDMFDKTIVNETPSSQN